MEILGLLNEKSEPHLKYGRGLKSKLAFLLIGALIPLGYTLAANINLGTGSALEFGQGIQIATSCDDQINIQPTSTFSNWDSKFQVTKVQFSDISNRCIGKSFEIGFYSETSSILANPYGPLVVFFSDSQTANIHFELDSQNTTLAEFETYVLDTSTAGAGPNGNGSNRGASSFTLNYIVKYDFMPFFTSDVSRITLKTHDKGSYQAPEIFDDFFTDCLSAASSNSSRLEELMAKANSKTQALSDLIDMSLAVKDEFDRNSLQVQRSRASEYLQFAETGMRLSEFQVPGLTACVSRMQGFITSENDNYRWALQSAIRDAALASLDANDDAFTALTALRLAASSKL